MAEVEVHVRPREGGDMPMFWEMIAVHVTDAPDGTGQDRTWLLVHGIRWTTVRNLVRQLRANFERSQRRG